MLPYTSLWQPLEINLSSLFDVDRFVLDIVRSDQHAQIKPQIKDYPTGRPPSDDRSTVLKVLIVAVRFWDDGVDRTEEAYAKMQDEEIFKKPQVKHDSFQSNFQQFSEPEIEE